MLDHAVTRTLLAAGLATALSISAPVLPVAAAATVITVPGARRRRRSSTSIAHVEATAVGAHRLGVRLPCNTVVRSRLAVGP